MTGLYLLTSVTCSSSEVNYHLPRLLPSPSGVPQQAFLPISHHLFGTALVLYLCNLRSTFQAIYSTI
ncbi:hypothetical protein CW304_05450 [Bacillus sp. UFRGS-B20]|nr:hypothetical protein CW304_05450 [Bacillus sp. UFRGS-B20]